MQKSVLVVTAFWCGLFSIRGFSAEADLTRFGPADYSPDILSPDIRKDAFFGLPGEAMMIVTASRGLEPGATSRCTH